MSGRPKPPPPPVLSVGDRVAILLDGAPVRVTEIAKVLAGGKVVRATGSALDDYQWRKPLGEKAHVWASCYSHNALRPWQNGDERAIVLRDLRIKRAEADRVAGQSAHDAARYRAQAEDWMMKYRVTGSRIEEAVADRNRLDLEIAALEKEASDG